MKENQCPPQLDSTFFLYFSLHFQSYLQICSNLRNGQLRFLPNPLDRNTRPSSGCIPARKPGQSIGTDNRFRQISESELSCKESFKLFSFPVLRLLTTLRSYETLSTAMFQTMILCHYFYLLFLL